MTHAPALTFALNIRDPRLALGFVLVVMWFAADLEPDRLLDVLNVLLAAF